MIREYKYKMENSLTSPNESVPTEDRFVDADRANSVLRGLTMLYEERQFTDISLCVGDQEFPCHKNILAISSPYFFAMFSNDLRESQQSKIALQEIEPTTISAILDYIYKGELTLTEDTVQGLLSAANLFQIIPLRDGCAKFMMSRVTMSNCIGVYFFAKAHFCEDLARKANEIINRNFTTLCKEQEFLMVPADQLVEILRTDCLNVSSEETVYEACIAWLNCSLEERSKNLVQIMKCVRFANVSSYYFCDKIDSYPLLRSSPDICQILNLVKYYHMLRNRQMEIDLNFNPRFGMPYERGIVMMANPYSEDSGRKFNCMELLVPRTGKIYSLCKLPQSVYMPGACVSGDNQIYLAGGAVRKINYRGPFSTEGVSKCLSMYDKMGNSWKVKAQMYEGRSQFSLAIVDGSIIALGGQNESNRLDSVELYDVQNNIWKKCSPMPQALRCLTATGYKGSLYVFGGETDSEIVKTAYRYDLSEDNWIELPSMQVPRALAGSIVFKDKIYVIGGNTAITTKWRKELLPENTSGTVEIFDPVTETWSFGPELPNALCGAGVVKYGDTVMVIGGEDDKSWMAGSFILKHDGDTDCWVEGQELPTVMSTFGCVMANIPRDLLKETL